MLCSLSASAELLVHAAGIFSVLGQ